MSRFWRLRTPKVAARRVPLPGAPVAIALEPGGRLVLMVRSTVSADSLLVCDRDAHIIAQRDLDLPPYWDLRISESGAIWLGHGRSLVEFDRRGDVRSEVNLDSQVARQVCRFLVAGDGFYVGTARHTDHVLYEHAIHRIDTSGTVLWTKVLPQMEVGWPQHDDLPPLIEFGFDPLILSGGLLLVSMYEYGGGEDFHHCLEVDAEEWLWSEQGISGSHLTCAPGEFLIGSHGYGEFHTRRVGRDGNTCDEWPSHGCFTVAGQEPPWGVEYTNNPLIEQCVAELRQGGRLRRGRPLLPSKYTAYPVQTATGDLVFWREGRLFFSERGGGLHAIACAEPTGSDAPSRLPSRMLLDGRGRLYFTVGRDLWLVDTELGGPAEGIWPCGAGNARRNPVVG